MPKSQTEKTRDYRRRQTEKIKLYEEKVPALEEAINRLEEENKRLKHELAQNASGRVSKNIDEVHHIQRSGAPRRYTKQELRAVFELGRWSLIVEGAMEGDERMLEEAMEFFLAEPDPVTEPEDALCHKFMWLLYEEMAERRPIEWKEFRRVYLPQPALERSL